MIRPGKTDDVGAIDAFDPFGGSRELEAADGRIHIFEDSEGEPIAYISTAEYLFHGFPYITFLVVRKDHHRKGIATELLHHVAHLHRGQRIFISVESDNWPMLSLLQIEGFSRSGALSGLNDSHNGLNEVFYDKDVG